MYQPNRLLTAPIHKCLVEVLKVEEDMELLLRPARSLSVSQPVSSEYVRARV
ncbi:MAG: hypothetical protein KatS3mg021_1896 [Fimbriimonadales bacterium]|nr:MAG: hypothetical protein KatS3mg021_1896 [Fimbriimonadales bacterium]